MRCARPVSQTGAFAVTISDLKDLLLNAISCRS